MKRDILKILSLTLKIAKGHLFNVWTSEIQDLYEYKGTLTKRCSLAFFFFKTKDNLEYVLFFSNI